MKTSETMINYFIQSVLLLGLGFTIYYFILRKSTWFLFNRFYLLVSIIILLTLPFMDFQMSNGIDSPIVNQVKNINLSNNILSQQLPAYGNETQIKKDSSFSPLFIFWIVSSLLLLRYARNTVNILLKLKNTSIKLDDFKVVHTSETDSIFSFFGYLFIPKEMDVNDVSESILEHEKTHCNAKHSVDILFVELLTCFLWFNPFMWLYKNALRQNHEFYADKEAANRSLSLEKYAQVLLTSSRSNPPFLLGNSFNYKHLKNRFTMLSRKPSSRPLMNFKAILIVVLFCILAFYYSCSKAVLKENHVVVIDPGHGGKDPGLIYDDFTESQLCLQIAHIVKNKLEAKHIEVRLTRETDDFVRLLERTDFANESNADLFVSIHHNYSKEFAKHQQPRVYFYANAEKSEQSIDYAKIMMQSLFQSPDHIGYVESASFLVLKKTKSPAILLALPLWNNHHDGLSKNEYCEEKAEQIANGIIEIVNGF